MEYYKRSSGELWIKVGITLVSVDKSVFVRRRGRCSGLVASHLSLDPRSATRPASTRKPTYPTSLRTVGLAVPLLTTHYSLLTANYSPLSTTLMFIGEYKHTVDEKGRLAMPAKFRSDLSQAAIVTRGLDHCLYVFTRAEWDVVAQKLKAMPMTNANARAFQRLMLSGATDVELDSQGRVLVPEYLRTYAGIKKQAVIAGVYSRLEIWDEAAWEQYKAKTEADSNEIAEKLGELGI